MASFLLKRGIDSAKYLDDIVEIARHNYGYAGGCPVAERCAKTVLLVPCYYTLSKNDIAEIAAAINGGLSKMPK